MVYIVETFEVEMMTDIIFDLEGATTEELLEQICYRLDRHFPNEEDMRNKANLFAEAKEQIGDLASALTDLGLKELAAELLRLVE